MLRRRIVLGVGVVIAVFLLAPLLLGPLGVPMGCPPGEKMHCLLGICWCW